MPNWELFQNAYLTADDATKALIDSDKIVRAINLSVQAGDLTEEQVRAVLLAYPLFVLQVYTKEELVAALNEAHVGAAEHVVAQLNAVLGMATAASIEKPVGLHTMADDVARAKDAGGDEPTYTSTQAAILREGRTPTTPSDTKASSSAWGSTQS